MILKHENIRKISTGQGDDYTSDCSLDYPFFKENYNNNYNCNRFK